MKAIWNDQIIAESDDLVTIEGNKYFPRHSLVEEFFKESETTTFCGWKGEANYFDIEINGELNKDAAWYYVNPKDAAKEIKDRVAFWRGVVIVE